MRSYTSKILGVGGESEGKKTQQSGSGSSTSSPAVKAEVSDMAKALKRRLSEKVRGQTSQQIPLLSRLYHTHAHP